MNNTNISYGMDLNVIITLMSMLIRRVHCIVARVIHALNFLFLASVHYDKLPWEPFPVPQSESIMTSVLTKDTPHGVYHYCDVIMSAMAYQIIFLTIVYSTVYLGADQRKQQSSASLAFVREIHRWPVNSPHKGPVARKMFPFGDVIMYFEDSKVPFRCRETGITEQNV